VALAHREALIVRRLTVDYQHAVAARQHGDEVHVQCRCGGVRVIPWRLFQV
jgi:hypothetical protein